MIVSMLLNAVANLDFVEWRGTENVEGVPNLLI